jgi:hypothetical protein
MMHVLINIVPTLVSGLTCAGITFWLNVRAQKRRDIKELFDQAITAVRAAAASEYYPLGYGGNMSAADRRKLKTSIDTEAIYNNVRFISAAQTAIVQVSGYDSRLDEYLRKPHAIPTKSGELIAILEETCDSQLKHRRRATRTQRRLLADTLLGKSITTTNSHGQISCPARTSGAITRQ